MLALNPAPNSVLNPALNAFSPDLVTRLLSDALTSLGDIARSSTNPIERRRAATTLLRFMTARPPCPQRPARDTKAPTPRISPDASITPDTSNTPTTTTGRLTPQPPIPIPQVPFMLSASSANAPQQPHKLNPHPRTANGLLARVGAPPH